MPRKEPPYPHVRVRCVHAACTDLQNEICNVGTLSLPGIGVVDKEFGSSREVCVPLSYGDGLGRGEGILPGRFQAQKGHSFCRLLPGLQCSSFSFLKEN